MPAETMEAVIMEKAIVKDADCRWEERNERRKRKNEIYG